VGAEDRSDRPGYIAAQVQAGVRLARNVHADERQRAARSPALVGERFSATAVSRGHRGSESAARESQTPCAAAPGRSHLTRNPRCQNL
jgi:hypothetical protein